MADVDEPFHARLEDVDLEHLHDLFEGRLRGGDEGVPAGVAVAHEAPVGAEDHIEEEDVARGEMDEAHGAEPVLERSLLGVGHGEGLPDEQARDTQGHDGQGVEPVEGPDRQLPDVDAAISLRRWHGGSPQLNWTWWTCLPSGS